MIMCDEAINLTKLKNGWQVKYSWEEITTNSKGDKDTDWKDESYAYPTLEEALAQTKELALKIKE